ncbi:capsule biosynthesis protein [Paenibacillus swuensis]|uniref:Capsule biosynthesis protein n=2 Tax=Paenibacillus swuensis TaxID=1178515 RepID=A0A172TPT9_9BACL|nr:capsule biosynthesis protein [Paenibacillus swuensis]
MKFALTVTTILILLTATGSAVFGASAASTPVTMMFAGDILLDGYVGTQIKKFGIHYPWMKVAPSLRKADIAFANLETSVSVRGKPEANKMFTFRSEPKTLDGLKAAGVDGVSLANNHILDYGTQAMLDTMVHLDRRGIGRTGAGSSRDQAFKPYVKTVKGKKIAILGVSNVFSSSSWAAGAEKPGAASALTEEPLLSHVQKISSGSDFTVVYLHWNKEFQYTPEGYSRTLAKKLIDHGADLIVGAHSHTVMGGEFYKHKPIYYSLGNFIFNQSARGGPKTVLSMMLSVTVLDGKVTGRIIPAKIIGGQPRLMDAKFNAAMYAHFNKYSYNAKASATGIVTEKTSGK